MNRLHALDRESAASRASAYVYGNVLVLAALVALRPDYLTGLEGVAYATGTAVSTSARGSSLPSPGWQSHRH
ncbi:MAG: hypothetical protein GX610_03130 [Rhodococcus sp.]|nr:hypothetical protein [Rhodococcus sp. (in: high G+C Gram-positive bacteria)]